MQPVTWKNGTASSAAFCGAFGSGSGTGSPRRIRLRSGLNWAATATEVALRCEPTAPFGLPVVPEV
ncbi:hypothetical protein D3C85_1897280 [compost metagenome]